ncbi:MAG: lipopolysaccharide assembly protein LapA domain-containing protein, partial [Bacillota bacterium]|nr:lipopolysaccharide assembly protein LapA domain-containing protein [Bacillota bacterium]
MQLSFIIVLIISIFISIFAIQNGGNVTIDLFFAKYSVSQALVILISVGSGALIAGILGAFKRIKKSKEIRDLTKKVKSLEDESAMLKEKLKDEENDKAELEKINVDLKEEIKKNKELLAELKEYDKNRSQQEKEEKSSEKVEQEVEILEEKE